jgi:hypothetical protein
VYLALLRRAALNCAADGKLFSECPRWLVDIESYSLPLSRYYFLRTCIFTAQQALCAASPQCGQQDHRNTTIAVTLSALPFSIAAFTCKQKRIEEYTK